MKKVITIVSILLILMAIFGFSRVYAVEEILNSEPSSKMIEMSEKQKQDLADFIEEYDGSETYGFTAFILDKVRIFSIPLCFLGITVSAIYQYVIGIRKLDVRYKGFYTMIAFITLFVIAQVLPLVFVIVIKGFGRS